MAAFEDFMKIHPEMKEDYEKFVDYQELNFMSVYVELLNEVYNSLPYKIFEASFTFHFLYLCYCLFIKWQYRTIQDLQCHIPQVRRYIGCLVGILAAIVCVRSMSVSSECCMSALCLASTGCMLSTIAAFFAYGFNGTPDSKVGYFMVMVGIIITLPSVNVRLYPGQSVVALSFVGMFHILLGIALLTLSFRRARNISGVH